MRKSLNIFIIFLTAILTVLPFVLRFTQHLGAVFLDSDRLIVQLVFIFSCFAGILTAIEKKHLNIDIFTAKLSGKPKYAIYNLISSVNTMILTGLLFSTFPNFGILHTDTVFFVPVTVFFSALTVMFAVLLYFELKRAENKAAAIVGVILGLALAAGSISSLFYLLFNTEISFFAYVFNYVHIICVKTFIPVIFLFAISALLGMPLYIVISGIAYFSFMQPSEGYVYIIPSEYHSILTDTSIAAIPLFTAAGYLLAGGSAGTRILDFVKNSAGWLRGGVVISAVLVATFFTTFTGASGVTILALGGILSVILTGSGYSKDDAESLITASGSIGLMLPPSLAVIVYGATNFMTVNIFDLFKGALLPGLLLAFSMIIIGIIKDKSVKRQAFSFIDLKTAFRQSYLELLLPALIVFLYFKNILSLFETAAFTAIYAFVLEVFIRKDFSLKKAAAVILESIPVSGGVLIIIGAAKGLAFFLVDANVPDMLSELVLNMLNPEIWWSKYIFLALLNILLLLVGCIMDLYSAILVVSPLIIPVAENFGLNPVHTGVIFLTNLALGFLTPPIGMNLFIASYTFKKPIPQIIKNILPYLAVQFVILMLVTYIPWLSTVFLNFE